MTTETVRTDPETTRADDRRGWGAKTANALRGPVPIAIILSLIVGGLVIASTGQDPLAAYRVMVQGSLTGPGLASTFERAVPLLGMALAIAVAFRAGVFNLGAEGQMILGALAGTCIALFVPGPGLLVMVLAFVVAAVVGGLWGVLSALLENWLSVPILITSLLLAYLARYFASYIVRFPLKEKGSSLVATPLVPQDTRLPRLLDPASAFGRSVRQTLGADSPLVMLGGKLNWSVIAVVVLLVAIWFFNRRTVRGYESGMAGVNAVFSAYGGVATRRIKVEAMFASGAISGGVGLTLVLGTQGRLVDGALVATNYAWTGLLVALLAMSRPFGVALAACFFAALIVGGEAMARSAGVSAQISQVIQAVVIVFIALRVTLRWRRRRGVAVRSDDDGEGGRI